MLTMPQGSPSVVSVIGIDPGSHNTGVAVLEIDIATCQIVSAVAWTFAGSKLAGKNSWKEELFGAKSGRIFAHEDNLLDLFLRYQPVSIASESPYINFSFPQAGLVLTEVVSAIRHAVMRYDPWAQLYMVEPSVAKNAVGAPGNADKNVVKEKILQCMPIVLAYLGGALALQQLDEHSIDALAIAYSRYLTILG